ncbi:MAG TPA: hypothetical protein VNJ54_21215 [Plantibacter sp.]|uniref:hypothetical protein n=1 Tax=Plantibacter sp. TaxID=1871045 RepID=UPI002C206E37|nr:hypothetical protein [Plantibacter sp.]
MAQTIGGTADDVVLDKSGNVIPDRRMRFYLDTSRNTEFTTFFSDAALTQAVSLVKTGSTGHYPANGLPLYYDDAIGTLYGGAERLVNSALVAPAAVTVIPSRGPFLNASTADGRYAPKAVHGDSTYLEPFPIWAASGSRAAVAGEIVLCYGTAVAAVSLTRLTTAVTTAGVGQTLAKLGVYTVDGAGVLTRVAMTASDTTIVTTANAAPTLTVPAVTIAQGQRYALAFLSVGGTTQPGIKATALGVGVGAILRRFGSGAGPATGRVAAQTDFPVSIAAASVTAMDDAVLLLGRPT